MQFHLNGFQPGDPEIADIAARIQPSGASGSVPDEVDVLIVGCGPAGLNLAAQLSARLSLIEDQGGKLGTLARAAAIARETYQAAAQALSKARSEAAEKLDAATAIPFGIEDQVPVVHSSLRMRPRRSPSISPRTLGRSKALSSSNS